MEENAKEEKHNASRGRAEKGERRERIPFGTARAKLPRGEDPKKFHYRVFNDEWRKEPGRVLRAKNAGYEVVPDQEGLTVGVNGDGTAIKGVLMRIPKEWYEEDQAKKQEVNDAVDKEIKAGRFQEKPSDMRYVPKSGIHFEDKLTP